MKKVLNIGLLLSLFLNSYSQTLTIKGFVKDAVTLSPVKDVNITIKGSNSGTTTDASGNFSIVLEDKTNLLIFSHISYYKKEISYLNSGEILLQPKVNILPSFSIHSDPIVNITKQLPIFIIDYLFVDNNICLLAYNRKKINDIRLFYIDYESNILSQMKVEKADALFKNCFGDTYYLNSEEAIKIKVTKDSIGEMNRIPRNYFDISYKAIEFKIEDNIYFSTNHYQNFIRKYHFINLYDEEKEIHTILTIADSSKIEEFDRDYNFFFYAKNASRLGMSVTSVYNNLDLLRSNQPMDWEDQKGRFSPLEISVNNLKDSIFVFNYLKENLEVYNLNGILKRKIKTDFYKDKTFTGKIIVSEEFNRFYAVFNIGSIIQLREIDILNGKIKTTIDIPSYPFIENIKLTGNQIFFLYKKKVYQELKQLYRMDLL